ncbi:unnamed protein product [Durusdinium trenchii]|uniref:C2H2-type domain-containing protein n=2 Tax=Durusdinium trenchii TaxID=1381693 RepID=A0ABP0IJM3_9DINO
MVSRVLTVGDGDLSFSLALSRAFGEALQTTATTWLTCEELCSRYESAGSTREELLSSGVCVLHRVDACNLQLAELGCAASPFDVVIFNFPHLGDVAEDCHSPASEHVKQHQALLAHFLHSASSVTSEVHLTLCGEQASLWDLHGAAERLGWKESRRYAPIAVEDFAVGRLASLVAVPAEPTWRCRRKWRNGSLGFVHWASRYGYEHRRHESEQLMNIGNCTTFVFQTSDAGKAPCTLADAHAVQHQCKICGQECQDGETLAQHLLLPASPAASAQIQVCQRCSKAFSSQRALQQHVASCGSIQAKAAKEKDLKQGNGYVGDAGMGLVVSVDVVVELEGERLLHFARQMDTLRKHLSTKSSAKRAIEGGELTLNGERVEESRKLHPGDVVRLRLNKAREIQESTVARARAVKLVTLNYGGRKLTADSALDAGSAVAWQVIRSVCPDGVAIVWKPSGMRSLGSHAGTLQTSLPWLPELQDSFNPFHVSPTPLSRLEIGCSGLSLVALNEPVRSELYQYLLAGCVTHVFKALVHGRAGSEGETRMLNWRGATWKTPHAEEEFEKESFPEQEGDSEVSEGTRGKEDARVSECVASEPPSQVCLHVVSVQSVGASEAVMSTIELSTASACGRCCGSLCYLMRMHGTPVVGDMLARSARTGGQSQRRNILGGGKRKLQIECVGIMARTRERGCFLDVCISRTG